MDENIGSLVSKVNQIILVHGEKIEADETNSLVLKDRLSFIEVTDTAAPGWMTMVMKDKIIYMETLGSEDSETEEEEIITEENGDSLDSIPSSDEKKKTWGGIFG